MKVELPVRTYEEIAAAGGGIRSSVEAVRKADKKDLVEKVLGALHEMALQGTTTVEAKSGYGLTLQAELKSLEAIRDAALRWPGTVVATLLGAHVVPREFTGGPEKYCELVCQQMIPRAARRNLAAYVDVFCDQGAFSAEATEKIFTAASQNGLGVRAHVCQLSETLLGPLLRFHPASFDHLDQVSDRDIVQLAQHDTVATLLPGANYFLGSESFPPARKLIDAGVPVALATDYNPGSSPTASMPFVLSLACTHMKMSPAEAIAAATINGAWALRLADRKGSLDPGKDADLAVFEVSDYREIPYWFASNRCRLTIMQGEAVSNAGGAGLTTAEREQEWIRLQNRERNSSGAHLGLPAVILGRRATLAPDRRPGELSAELRSRLHRGKLRGGGNDSDSGSSADLPVGFERRRNQFSGREHRQRRRDPDGESRHRRKSVKPPP